MSDQNANPPPNPAHRPPDGTAEANEDANVSVVTEPAATEATGTSLADTTGTGTIIALGCIGATLFLIVLGLIYLGLTQLF
ncbi:MAG: hypothetical protein H0T72_07190 [Chloroflexia bacterium]|nr:hypothetical protein [Chloroflexia bacterium]